MHLSAFKYVLIACSFNKLLHIVAVSSTAVSTITGYDVVVYQIFKWFLVKNWIEVHIWACGPIYFLYQQHI